VFFSLVEVDVNQFEDQSDDGSDSGRINSSLRALLKAAQPDDEIINNFSDTEDIFMLRYGEVCCVRGRHVSF